jgi:hypothetical protein
LVILAGLHYVDVSILLFTLSLNLTLFFVTIRPNISLLWLETKRLFDLGLVLGLGLVFNLGLVDEV